jgi:argininosuccinate synthase
MKTPAPRQVVLAYSGGLDTSIIVSWLIERHGCDVVTYTGDVGQPEPAVDVEARALATGASRALVEDLRPEFVRDYVWPALRAGAVYEGGYLLGTALARPVLARRQVEVARDLDADALAHGCTGKGNDQLRFELVYRALAPDLQVIAPWREWDIRSREDALAYAERRGIPVPVARGHLYSRDGNLWHLSHEGGCLEDPWCSPPADLYQLTTDPQAAPDSPYIVTLGFEAGCPRTIDGRELAPHLLLGELNRIAGAHGVGRLDVVENRVVGLKSRGVYETPGGTVLMMALRDLEGITLDAAALRERVRAGAAYADLVYRGLWFTPVREALDALVARLMEPATGEVRVELYKGGVRCLGRRSSQSLYNAALSTFGAGAGYEQADAGGFIRLAGLPLAAEARRGAALAPDSLAADGMAPDAAAAEPADPGPADPELAADGALSMLWSAEP